MTDINPMSSMKLELVPVPVSDIDQAKAFYVEKLGFTADHDIQPNDSIRIVQLTPPGSACSILLGKGLSGLEMVPGSLRGLHLVVGNISQIRETLISRGVGVSEIDDQGGVKYVHLSDPDGNSWALQEMPWRSA